MKTPFGFDCDYFYGDYHRGKNIEECRLIGTQPSPNSWNVSLCKTCPVPGILRANACSNMILKGRVRSTFLGLNRRVEVTAYCKKVGEAVKEPHVGCGECHVLPEIFRESDS